MASEVGWSLFSSAAEPFSHPTFIVQSNRLLAEFGQIQLCVCQFLAHVYHLCVHSC